MTDAAQTQGKALSVSAAMQLAKSALESVTIRILGEVSELSNKAGYKAVYFTVKDEHASLPCMMWKNRFDASGADLRIGSLVELTGRFSLYAAKGRMNFDVFTLSMAGEGDLRLKVANLARMLEAEGLMRPESKVPIPVLPDTIGVVTSPRGAAVHDVLRTLRRRYPLGNVKLAGVPVEGAGAAAGMIEALRCMYRAHVDVILLVRGGGSFEDLMPFNDESLARAIAACPIPVVTGIGHEPDTCIADMVADLRASTPTAAAESVSPSMADLGDSLRRSGMRMGVAVQRQLDNGQVHLDRVRVRPSFGNPELLFSSEMQALDMHRMRMTRMLGRMMERWNAEVALRATRLSDLSPLATLSRGFAIARDGEGRIIQSAAGVSAGDEIAVLLADGSLECLVREVRAGEMR